MIKKLAKSVREFKLSSILSPVFVALEVVMECLIPFLMAQLIDQIKVGDMGYIVRLGLVLAAMAVLSLIFGALSGKFAATASAGFAKNLRHDIYFSVQDFSFANIDKFSTSGLITRLTTDVTNVRDSYMMIIRIAVRAPLMFVIALCMSFSINVKLSLIFCVAVPLLVIGLYLILSRVTKIFDRLFKKYDDMNDSVQENINGIRVVKTYVREDYEKTKFGKVSDKLKNEFASAEKLLALSTPLMQFAMYLTIILISYFASVMIVKSGETDMTTGKLTSLITYITQTLSSLMMLSMVLAMISMSRASARRIAEVLDEKSTLSSPENGLKSVPNGDIDFDDVSFKYSATAEKDALSHVTLSIKSGMTLGIIGGTGSAKSTLVQLIPRLYDATQGNVRVGGIDVREYDLDALRNDVAMVLQKNELFSGTIKENLRWGDADASDAELQRVCVLAQADEFIQGMPDKYDTLIERGGSNVSGGQKQRLCIARALLKKPKILILDDSTSAVDTKTDALIRKALREEIPDTTKIIIAQRVASIEDADLIAVLDNGRLEACGTHEELLAGDNIYREVYYSQNKKEDGENA